MRLHQKGLSQLVKQRGGMDTLRDNWRLEMRILLGKFLYLKSPFQPLMHAAPILSKRHLPPVPLQETAPNPNFINLFSEIESPEPDTLLQYPAIRRAMEFLRSLAQIPPFDSFHRHLPEQEIERLMCIVYISFAFTPTQNNRFNLELLNDFLETTEEVWSCSVFTLRWLLIQSVGKGPAGLKDAQRTGRLAEIARFLTSSSYNTLEKRYLDILVQEPNEVGGLLSPEP